MPPHRVNTEFLQFSSSPDGFLEINTDFNTLLVTLDPPFVVPGTDLRASELHIRLTSDSLAEMDSNANPLTDRRDNVRLDFFEPRSEVSPDGAVRAWMRSTTRSNCSVVGPVVYIFENGVSPTRGSFLLQLSISSDTAGGGESHDLRADNHVETVVATYNPNFEAVKVRGEQPGTFCRVQSEFKVLPADDGPMRHRLTDFNQQPESHVLLGTDDSIANAQVFFYRPRSVEHTDWRTNLIPISTARPRLATSSHTPASPPADVEDDAAPSIASTNEAEAGSTLPDASPPAQESDAEIIESTDSVGPEETGTKDDRIGLSSD